MVYSLILDIQGIDWILSGTPDRCVDRTGQAELHSHTAKMSCTPESKGTGFGDRHLLFVFSSSTEPHASGKSWRGIPGRGAGFVLLLLHLLAKAFYRQSPLAHSTWVGAEVAGMRFDKRAESSGRSAQLWKYFLLPQTKDGAWSDLWAPSVQLHPKIWRMGSHWLLYG